MSWIIALAIMSAQSGGAASVATEPQETAPIQAVRAAEPAAFKVPAGSEIPLRLTETVTTKGDGWNEGDQFNMVVAAPVMLGDFIVIPEGTKAVGRITWLTSKGMFGKSGKMDVELEYLELNGRRINLDGTYRQEGDGNTLATIGGVVLVPLSGFFITGKSGVIPQGRELMATLEDDLPVALPEGATLAPTPVQAISAASAPVEAETAPASLPVSVGPSSAVVSDTSAQREPRATNEREGPKPGSEATAEEELACKIDYSKCPK